MPPQESESRVTRRARKPGEAEGCSQDLAALVEHELLDDVLRPQSHQRRDRQAERLSGLEINRQLELRGLLNREVRRLCASENLANVASSKPIHVCEARAI